MEQLELSKILEFVAKLHEEKLQAIVEKNEIIHKSTEIKYRSEQINELAISLAKAQAEFNVAGLNKVNPYFKSRYADFMAVVEASRPSLNKYGLSVVQDIISYPSGENMLHTILMHVSGQWIESRMRIVPPKNDIQTMSSYNTYLKRISYSSLVGVVTGDEDDDGESAVATQRETFAKGTALNTKYNPREEVSEVITKEQLEELEYELSSYTDIAAMVLEGLHIQSLADMPKSKFGAASRRIREIKNVREGK
jgi:hypothetical protein